MDPTLEKARQVQAAEETAKAVKSIEDRLAAIEAKLDRVLPAANPAHPAPIAKK